MNPSEARANEVVRTPATNDIFYNDIVLELLPQI